MIRRNARMRRDYIYRKSLNSADARHSNTNAPITLASNHANSNSSQVNDESAEQLNEETAVDIDDEYRLTGYRDPKLILTTSRDPSSRLQQFVKELSSLLPHSQRLNRGATVVCELTSLCRANDVTDLIIVHEHRGQPDGLIVSHMPHGPTAYFGITNCILRHDIKDKKVDPISSAFPHLIFDKFDTKIGNRVQNILKSLFPVPKTTSQRVVTFANTNDFISFRHHTFRRSATEVILIEVGPRFEMRLYQIKLGTLEMKEAEIEWVLRPYMNTSSKRRTI